MSLPQQSAAHLWVFPWSTAAMRRTYRENHKRFRGRHWCCREHTISSELFYYYLFQWIILKTVLIQHCMSHVILHDSHRNELHFQPLFDYQVDTFATFSLFFPLFTFPFWIEVSQREQWCTRPVVKLYSSICAAVHPVLSSCTKFKLSCNPARERDRERSFDG